MTTNIDGHQTGFLPPTPRLSKEVLDQWKAESQLFFSNTRRRLQQIRDAANSEQMSHSPPSPVSGADERQVMQTDSALASRASDKEATQESLSAERRAAQEQAEHEPRSLPLRADAHAASHASQQPADDSLDRLQAIKRRLAAQLENSRR